ncbi:MAG: hypothetical protein HC771_03940, partial [Synechococcales cyanobacterium CRU_2_2]|nr:hypothetical protein [Synechococcales cyanobacterium CRU_2_2]
RISICGYLRGKYLNRKEEYWDHGSGGGRSRGSRGKVSDRHGNPLDFTQGSTLANNTGIVASNGILHGAVIEALGATGAA